MDRKLIKLSKSKWKDFFKVTFGTNNVTFENDIVVAFIGKMRYNAWISNGRIYVQIALDGFVFQSFYFNIDTFEYDIKFNDEQERLYKQELYEEWKSNL